MLANFVISRRILIVWRGLRRLLVAKRETTDDSGELNKWKQDCLSCSEFFDRMDRGEKKEIIESWKSVARSYLNHDCGLEKFLDLAN